jgi:CubicO group peptidase (beta-lactamase class C family)
MLKPKSFLVLLILGSLYTTTAIAQITPAETDQLVERTLTAFDVPGISVAIVKDGKIAYAHGYGVRSLATGKKTDEHTLYGIASNSKAFTSAAIGMLCDEGKMKLDDKVTDYIAEFKMFDPYVTAEFTVRDLLTHRSGLGLGAGDLMIFPDSADFTVKDIIHNLRYLKPVSSFRTKYDYDNLLYIVAGEVVARVSGMSWEDFVQKRIMDPLHMDESAPSFSRLKNRSDVADAHAPVNGKVTAIARYIKEPSNAAAGLYSNVTDLAKWAIVQMDNGKYDDGKQLFSEGIHRQMWAAQTVIPVGAITPYNTHFSAYGLGWFLADIKGYKEMSHTGGLEGMVTKVTLIPELKLGIIVLTNQESGAAFSAITNQIKDSYLGITGRDWVKTFSDQVKGAQGNAAKITEKVWEQVKARQDAGVKVDEKLYGGTYHDNWLGDATISIKDGKAWFVSKRAPKLTGEILPYKGNTMVVKWNRRSMNADAFAIFSTDEDGKPTGIKMKSISPLTDFSFDFQDLDFTKVK